MAKFTRSRVLFPPNRNDSLLMKTIVVNSPDNKSDHQLVVGQARGENKAITVDNLTYGPPKCKDILCRSKSNF